MATVAEVIVETLQAAGVKHCWGVPGDTLNYFTDAIRRSNIKWVHVRHEEVGGFAAGAEALLTGDLTACAGSCGPGSLHFINGLFESHRNRAPVVLIASQITSEERDFDFPQEVDFEQVYRGCSVFCSEIRSPGQARRKTAMAAQAALCQARRRCAGRAGRHLSGDGARRARVRRSPRSAGVAAERRRARPDRRGPQCRQADRDLWRLGLPGRA